MGFYFLKISMLPMKFLPILFFSALLFHTLNIWSQPAPDSKFKLVWEDDFNKDADGLPDPKKWKYEEGFIRNNEAQYYTRERLKNARIEQGKLIIEVHKEDTPNPFPKGPRIAHYTSASLITLGTANWKYGKIEVKAMMPRGQGVWPAIWTLGMNHDILHWPRCGEIDIMEMFGLKPDIIRGNFHYSLHGKHVSEGSSKRVVPGSGGSFHIYGMEWTPERIDLLIDGVVYGSLDVNKTTEGDYNPFRLSHYLILNLALGGAAGGTIDDSILPQRMVIDSVRVYQKETQEPFSR